MYARSRTRKNDLINIHFCSSGGKSVSASRFIVTDRHYPPKNMGGERGHTCYGEIIYSENSPPGLHRRRRAKKRREFIAGRGILLFFSRGRTRRKSCFRSSVHTLYASREKGEFQLMRTEQRKRRVLNEKKTTIFFT